MIDLLINDTAPSEREAATRFGGLPLMPEKTEWPVCRSCSGPMQFLGQLRVPDPAGDADRLLLIFMCQNDPGSCFEWSADKGGNIVIVGGLDGSLLEPPVLSEATVRESVYGARIERSE